MTVNEMVTPSKEYENKFFEVIEGYCTKRGERTKRKVTLAIVSAHQQGQDLAPTLDAKGFEDLSVLLQNFQKEWVAERKDWSYSLLVWANVQNLFEHIAAKFNHHGNRSE